MEHRLRSTPRRFAGKLGDGKLGDSEKLGDRALSDSLMKILPEGGDLSAFINHELHRLPND